MWVYNLAFGTFRRAHEDNSLKRRFENQPAPFVFALIIGAFVSGWKAKEAVMQTAQLEVVTAAAAEECREAISKLASFDDQRALNSSLTGVCLESKAAGQDRVTDGMEQ